MRFVDEGFLLLARGGRTPHALPLQRGRGDPLGPRVREELELLARARQSPRPVPVRAAGRVAEALRRATQLGA